MGDVTKLNLEDISKKVDEINAQIGVYEASYKNIYAQVDSLKTAYTEKDGEAFVKKVESFRNDFDNMKMLLDEYVAEINKIYIDFTACQNDIMIAVDSLESGY